MDYSKAQSRSDHRLALKVKQKLAKIFGTTDITNKAVALECLKRDNSNPLPVNKRFAAKIIVDYWHKHHGPVPKTIKREKWRKKPTSENFYYSDEWRKLRYQALKLHGAACQCCGNTAASSGAPLHVDHIKPRSRYPELELDLDNLQVLCIDCNLGKMAWDETDWRTLADQHLKSIQ